MLVEQLEPAATSSMVRLGNARARCRVGMLQLACCPAIRSLAMLARYPPARVPLHAAATASAAHCSRHCRYAGVDEKWVVTASVKCRPSMHRGACQPAAVCT